MTTLQFLVLASFTCATVCATRIWPLRAAPAMGWLLLLMGAAWLGIGARFIAGEGWPAAAIAATALLLTPAFLYAAALDWFDSHSSLSRWARPAVLGTGALVAITALTSRWHGLFALPGDPGVQGVVLASNVGNLVALLYAYAAIGLAIAETLRHRDASGARQSMMIFVALPVGLLVLSMASLLLSWQPGGVHPLFPGAAVASAAIGLLLQRQLLGDTEQRARELLFERLPEPVLVLDDQHRIVAGNPAFSVLVETPAVDFVGAPLAAVAGTDNSRALVDTDALNHLASWQLTGGAVAHYQVQVTPITASAGASRLLLMTEQSSRLHTEQALETADAALESANANLDRLKLHDEMTGLANQRQFLDELEREVARHQRSERRFGVIAIEADHFHLLAEQHGEALRDRALALIARAIEVEVRGTDLCARVDGDEFAVLAVQMKVPALVNLAERIRKRVLKVRPLTPSGERVRMSVSCGVGIFDPKEDDLRRLLARTHRYLSEAKRTGRNKVVSGD